MSKHTKADWQPWRDEIWRYGARETEGLDKDIEDLEVHIKKLREICPKDGAGYPLTNALVYLNKLQMRLDEVKGYLAGSSRGASPGPGL